MPASVAQQSPEPEISTREIAPSFTIRTRTNEVPVRVVVRDSEGNAVPGLTKDEFKLFDNRKPQVIGNFVVERLQPIEASQKAAPPTFEGKPGKPTTGIAPPTRFVAFYIDDTFMSFDEIVRTRDATERYLHSAFAAGDRLALYTSSGSQTVEFTNDPRQFEAALAKLAPHPAVSTEPSQCPHITEYEAYLISEKEDPEAMALGLARVLQCMCSEVFLPPRASPATNPTTCGDPAMIVKEIAREVWQRAQSPMQRTLQGIQDVVRRLSVMPGQRSIVWISPGFLGMEQMFQLNSLTDQALRARVVINVLDSRGLWATVPSGQADQHGSNLSGRNANFSVQYAQMVRRINTGVLEDAASSTGGVFVGNTNDYDRGLRTVGALPEVAYLLSFSPLDLKPDGRYHSLTVELVNPRGLSVQARKGYFAPSEAPTAEAQERKDLEDAVFTNEERNDLPLGVQTQFFMTNPMEGQLTVMARVDLHGARLHKEQQLSMGELRFVTALFDQNGIYIEGQSRIITMRLKDATLEKLLASGLRTGWRFKVKPGIYLVREVVRDGVSGGIGALSRTVEIPYPN